MACDEFVESDKEAWLELSKVFVFDPGNWAVHYLLYYWAKLMRARETIEIGVGRGHGTYMLGLHALEVGGHHTAIEVAPTHANRAVHIKDHFDLPVDVLCCDSKAVVWRKKIDLIYVDGGHSEEQVLGDIDNFSGWVRRNGFMIFDDYGKLHHGVTQAVDARFDPEVWDQFIFPYGGLWAIWRRK